MLLLKDYLTNRTQYVSFKSITSSHFPVKTGVAQGSILGSLLFIIYINDITKASNLFKTIIYADDTTLYSTLDAFGQGVNVEHNLNKELTLISDWLKLNKLSLNINKSKFIIYHMPQNKVKIPILAINSVKIECVDEFIFLGLIMHKHLKWNMHVSKVKSKILNVIGAYV